MHSNLSIWLELLSVQSGHHAHILTTVSLTSDSVVSVNHLDEIGCVQIHSLDCFNLQRNNGLVRKFFNQKLALMLKIDSKTYLFLGADVL